MHYLIPQMYMKLANLTKSDEGQDLVEYALVVCLISLACITGVNQVSSAITVVFSNISSSLA
jgi:pilus assembly protein Flp/PilA